MSDSGTITSPARRGPVEAGTSREPSKGAGSDEVSALLGQHATLGSEVAERMKAVARQREVSVVSRVSRGLGRPDPAAARRRSAR